MNRVKFLRKFLQMFIYTIVILGFSYQFSLVCDEYFKYPTVTEVTIVKVLPLTNFPRLVLCTDLHYDSNQGYLTQFADLWQAMSSTNWTHGHPWGDPRVTFYQTFRSRPKSCAATNRNCPKPDDFIDLRQFILQSKTCISIRTRSPLNMDPEELLRDSTFPTVHVRIDVKMPIYRLPIYGNNGRPIGHPKNTKFNYYYYMTSYECSDDVPLSIPQKAVGWKDWTELTIELSFTQKVTSLAPPPYDTNCRDYRMDRLISQSDCIKKCLNKWTVKEYQTFFTDHVLNRGDLQSIMTKYSQLNPMHPDFKDNDMTSDVIDRVYKGYYNHSEMDKGYKPWGDYWKRFGSIFPDLKERIVTCQNSCSQADCEMEHVHPYMITYGHQPTWHTNFSTIDLKLYPPREAVVMVTSVAKLALLDFAIYLLSCLSFWLGFCPLSMSGGFLGDGVHVNKRKTGENITNSENTRKTTLSTI